MCAIIETIYLSKRREKDGGEIKFHAKFNNNFNIGPMQLTQSCTHSETLSFEEDISFVQFFFSSQMSLLQ